MIISPLATQTIISPNKALRTAKIDTITVHCMAANATVRACGNLFAQKSRNASSNYGIASSGEIGCYVPEEYRSYCSSNKANDNRAITVEVANDGGAPQWHVSDHALYALVRLLTDVCKRNGIKKLVWSGNAADRVNHKNGCNMTVHRDFSNKSCPGDYLYSLHPWIADEVNRALGVTKDKTAYVYQGVDYSPVFDAEYYASKYADLAILKKEQLFEHFCLFGMSECRQASNKFNPIVYRMMNKDLDAAFGDNWFSYYWHYCVIGKTEHRITV